VNRPYASFLVGGGQAATTRVELVRPATPGAAERVEFSASGADREQMQRVAVDLRPLQGRQLQIRLVDESKGGWGHLNFDDFRFHDERPQFADAIGWRTTANPVLQHLVLNPQRTDASAAGSGRPDVSAAGFSAKSSSPNHVCTNRWHFISMLAAGCGSWRETHTRKNGPGARADRILTSDENGDGSMETQNLHRG
jgi:hypothetical protein